MSPRFHCIYALIGKHEVSMISLPAGRVSYSHVSPSQDYGALICRNCLLKLRLYVNDMEN